MDYEQHPINESRPRRNLSNCRDSSNSALLLVCFRDAVIRTCLRLWRLSAGDIHSNWLRGVKFTFSTVLYYAVLIIALQLYFKTRPNHKISTQIPDCPLWTYCTSSGLLNQVINFHAMISALSISPVVILHVSHGQ